VIKECGWLLSVFYRLVSDRDYSPSIEAARGELLACVLDVLQEVEFSARAVREGDETVADDGQRVATEEYDGVEGERQ